MEKFSLPSSPPRVSSRRPGLFTLTSLSTERSGSGRRSHSSAAHRVKSHTLTTDNRKRGAVAFRIRAQRFRVTLDGLLLELIWESVCEQREDATRVWWKSVPELGSSEAESSAILDAEAGERHSEVDGGRGTEEAGWGLI